MTVIEGGDRIVLTIPDCKPEKLEVTCVGLKSGPARLELLPTALSEYFIQPLSASPHAIAVLSTYRIAIRQRKSSFNAYRPQGQVVAAPWERVLKLFAEWASVEAPQIFAIRYMEKPHADAKELYGFLACVQSCGARLPMFFSGPSSNWHVAPPGPPTLHQQWGGRPANLLGAPIELDGIAATKSTSMDLIPWANHSKSGNHKNLRWMTRARARR